MSAPHYLHVRSKVIHPIGQPTNPVNHLSHILFKVSHTSKSNYYTYKKICSSFFVCLFVFCKFKRGFLTTLQIRTWEPLNMPWSLWKLKLPYNKCEMQKPFKWIDPRFILSDKLFEYMEQTILFLTMVFIRRVVLFPTIICQLTLEVFMWHEHTSDCHTAGHRSCQEGK